MPFTTPFQRITHENLDRAQIHKICCPIECERAHVMFESECRSPFIATCANFEEHTTTIEKWWLRKVLTRCKNVFISAPMYSHTTAYICSLGPRLPILRIRPLVIWKISCLITWEQPPPDLVYQILRKMAVTLWVQKLWMTTTIMITIVITYLQIGRLWVTLYVVRSKWVRVSSRVAECGFTYFRYHWSLVPKRCRVPMFPVNRAQLRVV